MIDLTAGAFVVVAAIALAAILVSPWFLLALLAAGIILMAAEV